MRYFSILIIVIVFSSTAYSQPNPGYNGNGSENDGGPVGGAPIGGGIVVLLSLGAAYGLTKFYNTYKRKMDE